MVSCGTSAQRCTYRQIMYRKWLHGYFSTARLFPTPSIMCKLVIKTMVTEKLQGRIMQQPKRICKTVAVFAWKCSRFSSNRCGLTKIRRARYKKNDAPLSLLAHFQATKWMCVWKPQALLALPSLPVLNSSKFRNIIASMKIPHSLWVEPTYAGAAS